MEYILMHENKRLCKLNVTHGRITELSIIANNIYASYIPYVSYTKKLEDQLENWIYNRGIPVTRDGIKRDLRNRDEIFEYMLENLGLSLTDHYWICPINKEYTWENVNLYNNDFKSSYSLDTDKGMQSIAGKTNFVPSASLKGDLKKKWIIDKNGVRRLVKGNYGKSCRQSIAEVFASEIHKGQGKIHYTPYSLIRISSNGQVITGCECPNFTNLGTEFISAHDIVESFKKYNNTNYYEAYISYCVLHGIPEQVMRSFMEYEILTDFIITNTDRHLNNFGVLRDSRSLKFICPAPIFDSGNSLFYNSVYVPVKSGLLDINVTSFKEKEIQLLKYIKNPSLVDLRLLPSDNDLYNRLCIDNVKDYEEFERVVRAYREKIKILNDFQNGAKVYEYTYIKGYK